MLSRRNLLGLTGSLVAASLVAAPFLGACGAKQEGEAEPLKVAAASDLAVAFKEMGEAFEKKTGTKVTFSFGSTGLMTKQIKEGAPFDVFAAANVKYIDELIADKGITPDSKAIYGRGRIVVFTKEGPAIELRALSEAKYAKVSIANPEHAPYGMAAKQALEKAGLWDAVKPRLVYGENVQQALQFAESGNAEAAIVALSLAIHAKGAYTVVDEELHAPLDQALGICEISKQKDRAAAFAAFVNSDEGREIMKRHGFLLPGEALTAKQ